MKLPPEVESGNEEYKLKLVDKDNDRLESLASQMKWRLNEGNGIAKYYIGVADDGTIPGINYMDYIETLKNLSKISKKIKAKIVNKVKKVVTNLIVYYIITVSSNVKQINSLRSIFIGPSKAGKSTLIANLSRKMVDDGNGKSRTYVFNHKHEIYTGETSSISIQNMKINNKKNILHVNLIDTPGNSKYLKTTIAGLTKYDPHLIFLVIDPLDIDLPTMKFYIKLINYFNLPYYIIFTKYDLCKQIHRTYILKNLMVLLNIKNIKNIPYISISNLEKKGYKKINKILKNQSVKEIKNVNLQIQVCDMISIPNIKRIYLGISYNSVKLGKKYLLESPNYKEYVKLRTLYFCDNPKDSINKNNLITFTLENELEIVNNTDMLLNLKECVKEVNINIMSDENLNFGQAICIYNNQYNVIKIINMENNKYKLSRLDNLPFINLSDKIIIRYHEKFYLTKRI